MKILNGKTTIVTGAAQGIGAAIAKRLAEEGASVLVDDVRDRIRAAERVVSDITSEGGRAVAFPADISKPSEVKAMFQEAKKQFSKVDILVNNAALFKPVPLSDFSEEDFHWHFNSNVMGGFLCARESLAYFSSPL